MRQALSHEHGAPATAPRVDRDEILRRFAAVFSQGHASAELTEALDKVDTALGPQRLEYTLHIAIDPASADTLDYFLRTRTPSDSSERSASETPLRSSPENVIVAPQPGHVTDAPGLTSDMGTVSTVAQPGQDGLIENSSLIGRSSDAGAAGAKNAAGPVVHDFSGHRWNLTCDIQKLTAAHAVNELEALRTFAQLLRDKKTVAQALASMLLDEVTP